MASRILSLCFAATACMSTCSLTALAEEPAGEKRVYKTVGELELSIFVSQPAPTDDGQVNKQRPAIVFFHGGGWTGGAPGQFSEHAKYFSSRGVVCFQAQYRLLDKSSKEPPITCTEDAVSAMRWVRDHCDEFSIDPDRIASAGGSAGGHLAAFVGCVDVPQTPQQPSPKPNAMLLFNPVYDNGPGGWGTARVGDRYQEFSPLHNLSKDDPPSIVFLGTEDKLIPVATAENFRDTSLQLGLKSELHTYDGQPHGFFNFGKNDGRYYYETVLAADNFLASLGWLQGAATLTRDPAPSKRNNKTEN